MATQVAPTPIVHHIITGMRNVPLCGALSGECTSSEHDTTCPVCTGVIVKYMRDQRRCSVEYVNLIFGREVTS